MTPLSWSTIGRVALAVFAAWVLVQTWQIWMVLLTAVILAAAILPAARWGDQRRIPRLVTVIAVYAGFALVLAVLGRFLVPALAEQTREFVQKLPLHLENARGLTRRVLAWVAHWELPLPPPTAGADGLQKVGQVLLENTLRATAGMLGAVVGFFLVLVLAAYLVLDAERIGFSLARMLPPRPRAHALALAPRVLAVMGGYVRGQLVVSLCVGTMIAVGLALLGVPYWLLIGGIAFALNVVPFLGSPAAAVLGIVSAVNISPMLGVWTGLLFWGANLVEGKLFAPHFVGRATGLHPLAVLLTLLVGAHLAGLVGALVAVPFLAGLWEIVRTLWVDPRRDGRAR